MEMRHICCVVASVLLTFPARSALAWKPNTHVHLAQEAWEDAKDGKVTLHRVDYETGAIGASLGEFAVSPELLDAIRRFPASYFAGVLGPDAYPDMVTGQMRVHPPGRGHPDDPDLNEHGPGTPPWLRKLWMLAFTRESTPHVKAFVAGYLAHAAADVYAHTYVNGYTGGIFDLLGRNGLKHMILEGYLEQRTPALRQIVDSRSTVRDPFAAVATLGIRDGVDGFIARNTAEISCATCSNEENRLLSLPWNFVQIRNWLDGAIAKYDRTEATLRGPLGDWIEILADAQARVEWACDLTRSAECPIDGGTQDNCPGLDKRRASLLWCPLEAAGLGTLTALSAPLEPAMVAWRTFTTTLGPAIRHARGWRRNIDAGLVRWVQTNHRVAQHLFYNARGMDIGAALSEIKAFAPVAAAMAAGIDIKLVTTIQDGLQLLKAPLDEIKRLTKDMYEDAFRKLIGISPSELQEKYASSHAFIDPLFTPGTRVALDRSMKLPTAADDDFQRYPREPITRFDWRQFPAAYNTVTLTKLSLLAPSELNRLYTVLAGLSPAAPLPRRLMHTGSPPDNIMLGWGHTIDGSNQWLLGMPLADNNCVLYRRLFMRVHPGPATRDRGAQHPAEPKDECTATAPLLTVDAGYHLVAPKHTLKVSVSADAILEASAGSITPCRSTAPGKPCDATFTAPDTGEQLDVVITVKPRVEDSRRPPIEVWVNVQPELELRVAAPDANAPSSDLVGAGATLRPGQRVTLEVSPQVPVTWTLEGPGTLTGGKPVSKHATSIAANERLLDGKRLALAGCRDASCIQRAQADIGKLAKQLSIVEQAAAVDDMTAGQRVYVAPAKLTGAKRAVIRATTADGRTAAIEFALRGRPLMPVRVANPKLTVRAGQVVQLEVTPPLPVKWTIGTGGVGTIGEAGSAERKRLELEVAPLHAKLKNLKLHDPRSGVSGPVLAKPMDLRPRATAKGEIERYVREDVAAKAAPLAELAKLENTYRAPAKVVKTTTVVVTGIVQDGTGRKVTAQITVTPERVLPIRVQPLPRP